MKKKPNEKIGKSTDNDSRVASTTKPSAVDILACLTDQARPISLAGLTAALGMPRSSKTKLERCLRAMEKSGDVFKNRRGHYALPAKMDLIVGRVIAHPDGYGFLTAEGQPNDLYIAPRQMRKVLHGDRVVARVSKVDRRGRREAQIVDVVEHQHHTIVGRFVHEAGAMFVIPQDRRITHEVLIPPNEFGDAQAGEIVVAQITRQPNGTRRLLGKVTEVLGAHLAPGMEVEIAIRKHELPHRWPTAVSREASRIRSSVGRSMSPHRKDLRSLAFITIDGEDARDYDDAVYCEPSRAGWRLLVAIADVAHYVKVGSAIDGEALTRGNSVYFSDRVVPMLPERLSNNVCSLNPNADRLCMVCEVELGKRGAIKDFRFYEGVMRSYSRMTYSEVAKRFTDRPAHIDLPNVSSRNNLDNLYELFHVLRRRRQQRGAIDLDLPETRIIVDAQKKIERIEIQTRNDAHRLIEECMLVANVCAAKFIAEHSEQAIYRIHEKPDAEKIFDLRRFLGEFGLHLSGGSNPSAGDFELTVSAAQRRPELAAIIQMVMLRSLKQAVYSTERVGHFALNYELYTHFTSPIRRYPDLVVHRLLKAAINTELPPAATVALQAVAEHCSSTERRADDATRDVTQWLKAEYMLDRVGEVYAGIISGVAGFGVFVQLDDSQVEGLVHVTELGNDYYHYDAARYRLTGERTGQVFRLGSRVRVRVMRVDLDNARIDFKLVDGEGRPKRRKGRA